MAVASTFTSLTNLYDWVRPSPTFLLATDTVARRSTALRDSATVLRQKFQKFLSWMQGVNRPIKILFANTSEYKYNLQ